MISESVKGLFRWDLADPGVEGDLVDVGERRGEGGNRASKSIEAGEEAAADLSDEAAEAGDFGSGRSAELAILCSAGPQAGLVGLSIAHLLVGW